MTRTIAHRGFAGVAPENTLAAVRTAAERGADFVEVDAVPSADGTVVVFHDDRLDGRGASRGITDGRGVVWETPAAEIAAAEVLDSGEHVPTLAEVRDALPEDVGLNVELKNPGIAGPMAGVVLEPNVRDERAALWRPFVADVASVLDGFPGEVLYSSFAEGALAALRAEAPEAALVPIVDDALDVGLELAARYDADAIHASLGTFGLTGRAPARADPRPVERAHDAGYDVNAWTVTTWYQAARLHDVGVDGLVADYPGLRTW